MNKLGCCLFILLCVVSCRADGQENESTPSPPFIGLLPDKFGWVITYKRTRPVLSGETPPRTRKELAVVKTGIYQQEILTWSDGTKSTTYFVQGCELLQNPATKTIEVIPGGLGSQDLFAAGFADAAWVSASSFQKTVKLAGRSCHHYIGAGRVTFDQRLLPSKTPGTPSSEAAVSAGGSEAWIDEETRFPVLVKTRDEIIEYRYPAPPKEDLVLPEEFAICWNKYQRGLRLMNAMRMP